MIIVVVVELNETTLLLCKLSTYSSSTFYFSGLRHRLVSDSRDVNCNLELVSTPKVFNALNFHVHSREQNLYCQKCA